MLARLEKQAFIEQSSEIEGAFRDSFTDSALGSTVIGRHIANGVVRKGIDVEGVLSIDNGALRIQPLINPGWGRAGIAYGPYDRQNGLTLTAFILNGHNTSQSENIPDRFLKRLDRWLRGSETYGRRQRLYQWLRSNRKRRTVRQMRNWLRHRKGAASVLRVDENLALGWFSTDVPVDPLRDGNGFVIHATGPENGELWARVAANQLPAIRGLQNLQLYYVIILREQGAVYYAASVPDANGLSAYPYLRPLAIDSFDESTPVYAALYQSVLGQIGFRLDTRAYAIQVSKLNDFSTWYGTAHVADQLTGNGALGGSAAEVGGFWRVTSGEYFRTENGVRPASTGSMAVLNPDVIPGLIHTLVETGSPDTKVSLIWRFKDNNNFWSLTVSGRSCRLSIKENGADFTVSATEKFTLKPGSWNSLQVLDDGTKFGLYLQGQLLFDSWFCDGRLENASGVGFLSDPNDLDVHIARFEAHPRQIQLPKNLDLGEPWFRKGKKVVLVDDFKGSARDLSGKATTVGQKVWKRQIGTGIIELTGDDSARIRATRQNPSPGRSAYTIDWDYPEFADLEVTITPPGTGRGEKEHGLSGFIIWQDDDNYITLNIWVADFYRGASISTFFHLDGFEDLYDAIWSNVGSRVHWGIPCRLRVVFDGLRYIAFVNDEPVLYRALTDVYSDCKQMQIKRVGLIANWEWGRDTGSVFNDFIGRI